MRVCFNDFLKFKGRMVHPNRQFCKKQLFWAKNCEKGVKNALLTDILVDKAYLVTFES